MNLFVLFVRTAVAARIRSWRRHVLAKARKTAGRRYTGKERRIDSLERQLEKRTRELNRAEATIEVLEAQLEMLSKWQAREESRLDREAARYAADRAIAHRQANPME